uniref:RxLR effector protein n=1 Tax=Phytophthora infestans TaxID=4787 RepID=A0A0K0YD81_PHYIN|nr:effector protein IpiO [Phytophthora infestans]
MRSLLLTVLLTLVVLLATTGAVSSNLNTAGNYASTSKIRFLSTEYSADEKRSLRGDYNSEVTKEPNTADEERAFSISKSAEYVKMVFYAFKIGFSPRTQSKTVLRYEDKLFTALYKSGETPISLRTKYLDKASASVFFNRFKNWYDKNVGPS